ncbi:EI24 domain-containing protein [Glaciihabitans sp. UYNi722]|uniref:EI24 domain-containing protein n=1 Tax=Glaciihabitans sp. UYNi722 TaxID=3156344 RepID=UPI00339680CB
MTPTLAPGTVRRFLAGMGYLGRGLGMWITSPRLMLFGALPALIVGAVYTAALVVFLINLNALAVWVTPFAGGWNEPWRGSIRVLAGTALVGAVILLGVFTFATLTLAVGDAFYEKIWLAVEQRSGGAPAELKESFWRSVARGLGTGIRLLAITVLAGIVLFVLGFIPVVGQVIVPVLGAIIGGWFLTVELTGFAFNARGLSLRQRRRMLGTSRATSLGFGILTYLLFLVPLGAVLIMPAAVAGATLLSRDVIHKPVITI